MIQAINKKKIIEKMNSYDKDILFIGRLIHRTHKNKPLNIKYKSPLWYLYNDSSPYKVIKKAVQIGVSEWLIVVAIESTARGLNVIYILPTFMLKNQFVQDRINKSIMFTPYYQEIMKHDDKKLVESTTLKQFGAGSIIFAGSNTTVSFISHPGDVLIIDEEDECNKENLLMGEERLARSESKMIIRVGNPKFLGVGIDYQYGYSDKKEWQIKHDCGKWIQFDFFKQVIKEMEIQGRGKTYILCDTEWEEESNKDINMICEYCNKPIDRHKSGEFISQKKSEISGYHMSSLFASEIKVKKMVDIFKEGLINDLQMQRFYNAYLGLAYNASGAKITEFMLNDCIDTTYTMPDQSVGMCLAGVDVGKVFNIIIAEIQQDRKLRIVNISELPVEDIREVFELFMRYKVKLFVIDSRPETRIARQIIAQWKPYGHGFLNQYTSTSKDISWNLNDKIISCGRTYILDTVKEMLLTKQIILPQNARSINNFYSQMTASTRVFNDKRQEYVWTEGGNPDHWFHGMAYLALARSTLIQIQ